MQQLLLALSVLVIGAKPSGGGKNGGQRWASEPFARSRSETLWTYIAQAMGYSGYQKAQARAFTHARSLRCSQLPRALCQGLIIISFSPRVMAARKRTNERSCITALFSNPLRFNGEKMTPSHCFGLSGS